MTTQREPEVEFYQEQESGLWRWRVKAGNGEIVASGEQHVSRWHAERAFRTAVEAMGRSLAIAEQGQDR